jgi:hypothetical protein
MIPVRHRLRERALGRHDLMLEGGVIAALRWQEGGGDEEGGGEKKAAHVSKCCKWRRIVRLLPVLRRDGSGGFAAAARATGRAQPRCPYMRWWRAGRCRHRSYGRSSGPLPT